MKNTEKNINTEDKQISKELDEELNSVILRVNDIMKQNDCIKTEEPIIFEIKDKEINRESNEESINESTVMTTENMDVISELEIKSEQIFEVKDVTNIQLTYVSPYIVKCL